MKWVMELSIWTGFLIGKRVYQQALGPHQNQKHRMVLFLCGSLTGGSALAVQAAPTRQEQEANPRHMQILECAL